MAFTLSSTVLLIIRAVQALFAVIVLGTAGYVASWWNGNWRVGSPGEINFMIFNSVWTFLALAFLVVVPMRLDATRPVAKFGILIVEALTTLFWFAGFIALAVWVSYRVCYGSVCNSAKAAAAFGAFEWVLFVVTTTFAFIHGLRGNRAVADTSAPAVQKV